MEPIHILGAFVGVCFAAYVVIRIASAAYYQSKQDYERSKKNGPK